MNNKHDKLFTKDLISQNTYLKLFYVGNSMFHHCKLSVMPLQKSHRVQGIIRNYFCILSLGKFMYLVIISIT